MSLLTTGSRRKGFEGQVSPLSVQGDVHTVVVGIFGSRRPRVLVGEGRVGDGTGPGPCVSVVLSEFLTRKRSKLKV